VTNFDGTGKTSYNRPQEGKIGGNSLVNRPERFPVVDPSKILLQSLRPEDVVHHRDQLVAWWSKKGEWQHTFAMQGRHGISGWDKNQDREAEETRWWTHETFKAAELYWVSPEMSTVIEQLAPSIPDCLPQPPVTDAFVMFAKPIEGTDSDLGGTIWTSAFLWGPVNMFRLGQSVSINTYAWRDLVSIYQGLSEKEQEHFRSVYPPRLMPTGGSEWPLTAMTNEFPWEPPNATKQASMVEDRRLLATFWALASQKIVIETRERPYSRQVQRNAERHGHVLPDIRVIRLREATSHAVSTGEGGREWSHRWLVGSHWRNQWYAREQTHRPKLIEAYVKGPEDKPLKVRETVRALVK
jgi:hypothetical protein